MFPAASRIWSAPGESVVSPAAVYSNSSSSANSVQVAPPSKEMPVTPLSLSEATMCMV